MGGDDLGLYLLSTETAASLVCPSPEFLRMWLKSQPHYSGISTNVDRKVSGKLLGASICGLSLFLDEGRRKEAHERTLEQQHRVPGLESFILDHSRLCSAKMSRLRKVSIDCLVRLPSYQLLAAMETSPERRRSLMTLMGREYDLHYPQPHAQ